MACGHPPPKAPPPAEKTITGVGDLAGSWVTDDERGWFYRMQIDAKGAMTQRIERDKLAACEQKGALAIADSPKALSLTYAKNTCSQEFSEGTQVQVEVSSFTGQSLTLVITGYGGTERRDYHRDPSSKPQ